MKRKNPEFVKTRRFIRKAKFSENLSSKYEGFAFSFFFLFITLTSNAICFFLVPVQWLFFTASTYVWFQYVWNSEKGICLQTFTVWLIFVYIEATVRLKELKNVSTSLDICRPMAAHSLGSQVVMLGFGFKKYLNYKIMLRRQKDVQIDNELTFYTINKFHILDNDQIIKDNNICQQQSQFNHNYNHNDNEYDQLIADQLDQQNQEESDDDDKRISPNLKDKYDDNNNNEDLNNSNLVLLIEHIFKIMTIYLIGLFRNLINLTNFKILILNLLTIKQQQDILSDDKNSEDLSGDFQNSINNNNLNNDDNFDQTDQQDQSQQQSQQDNSISNTTTAIITTTPPSSFDATIINQLLNDSSLNKSNDKLNKKQSKDNKNEIKKLKNDLQLIKQSESEYKDKLQKIQNNRNELKFQCSKLQSDNTALQTKLHNLLNTSKQDKNLITDLEKRLQEERKIKSQLEIKLSKYSNRQLNQQQSFECGDQCKQQKKETDELITKLKDEQQVKDLKFEKLNDDLQNQKSILLKYVNTNSQLETKLREETKLKLELFSVLGETRRQLDINKLLLYQKQSELDQLNNKLTEFSKLSELIAIMPNIDQFNTNNNNNNNNSGSLFLPQFLNSTNNNDLINDDLINRSNNNFNNINSNLINNNITVNQQTSTNLINTTSTTSINQNNLFNISNNSTLTTTSSNSLKDGSLTDWKQINLDNLDYEQSTGENNNTSNNSNNNSTTPTSDL